MTTTARVTSPAAVAGMVPHLVGFEPADGAAVVIALTDKRVTFTAHLSPEVMAAGGAADVARTARANDVPDAVVIGYGSPAVAEQVAEQLDGLHVLESLTITGPAGARRYRSNLCTSDACCPPDGLPVADDSPAAVGMIAEGSAPLASRADLGAEIAPAPDFDTEPHPLAATLTPTGDDYTARDLWLAAAAAVPASAELSRREAAAAARTLHAGDPRRLHVLACYAAAAYLAGNGARCNVAIEMIEAEAAAHHLTPPSLAGLIDTASGYGVPPQVIAQSFREAGREIRTA